jgi:hypothetical protein
MVAEPTLFLTIDRVVQVRAHTTRSGMEVFCVKDFIRETASTKIGPNDAMVYWISSLNHLTYERDVMDTRMVKFLGPYEKSNPCINASGLLILYIHLCERFTWVNDKYKSEVVTVLKDIIQSNSAAAYVAMFDDGEVDALMLERGDRDLDCPPEGSKFNFVDEEKENALTAKIKALEEEKARTVNDLIAKLEAKSLALDEANAKLCQKEMDQETKRRKQSAFSIGDVVEAKGLHISSRDIFCKKVIARFKDRFPGHTTFKRHGATLFFAEDKAIIEGLVHEEHELLLESE